MVSLTDVKGVSDSRADDLREEGYTTVDDIATTSADDLSEVSGIGTSTAEGLIESAQDVIRDDTLTEEDEDEEDDYEVPDLEDEDDEEDEVTVEDLEELNGEAPDGPPTANVNVEDDEGEPREVDVTPEVYEVTLSLENDEEYVYFMHAITEMLIGNVRVTYQQSQIAEDILSEIISLDGAAEITLDLTEAELNALNVVMRKTARNYKNTDLAAFHTVRAIGQQVSDARDEFLN